MSNDVVISVEGLGKRYSLGAGGRSNERYTALRDVIARSAAAPFRSLRNKFKSEAVSSGLTLNSDPSAFTSTSTLNLNQTPQNSSEEFWALKNVSFDIKQGEVVGIIGRNGAGKSTLLKILSRITDPTEGRIKIKGRIASLLEVGTGFHPELSGRENIYLNGAILGMSRAEIKAKFDEIVAFAEVEKFLDTPVKRYSSGMYVRLAFAVAAHLEPEILIVDEVLAVGDAEFQKKCLGKISAVTKGGRTVLFVSHNLAMIREICSSGVFLKAGNVAYIGKTEQMIRHYAMRTPTEKTILSSTYLDSISDHHGNNDPEINFGGTLLLKIALRTVPAFPIGLNIGFRNGEGRLVCLFSTNPHDGFSLPISSPYCLGFCIEACYFAPGDYSVDIAITQPGVCVLEELNGILRLSILPKAIGGTWAYEAVYGDHFPPHWWKILDN